MDRLALHYPGKSGGPARRVGLLLIHGLGGTPVEMKTVARRVAETGASVLCCRLAGHCGTEQDLIETRWQDWLASARAALLTLAQTCDTVLVGGLSLGAVLAAHLCAVEKERVGGLVLLAPTLQYDGWSIPWYSFLLKWLINTPIGRRYRFEEREPYGIKDERIRMMVMSALRSGDPTRAGLEATPSTAVREMWRLVAATKPLLPSIDVPALVVHAREDDISSVKNAFYMLRNLGGAVEMLLLDDSYHLVTVDRQRKQVTERVARFVLDRAEAHRAAGESAGSTRIA